jgi:hypothetical protein
MEGLQSPNAHEGKNEYIKRTMFARHHGLQASVKEQAMLGFDWVEWFDGTGFAKFEGACLVKL